MKGRGEEQSTQGRGISKATPNGQEHAHQEAKRHSAWLQCRVGERIWDGAAESDSSPDQAWPLFLWREWAYLSRALWSAAACILCTFLESRTWNNQVSHLEKVPRHVVSWELAKPTLSKLHNLFLQCFFFFSHVNTVNLSWKQTLFWKNTVLFKTLQAVWHVVLHPKILHLLKNEWFCQ